MTLWSGVNLRLVATRECGRYPNISVGTSLAIEALVDLKMSERFNVLGVNLRTLVRNFYGSHETETANSIDPRDVAVVLMDEITAISDAIAPMQLLVYHADYRNLRGALPNVTKREPSTDKAIAVHTRDRITCELLLKNKDLNCYTTTGWAIEPPFRGKILILSHYPVDLLSRSSFLSMHLLESYTGVVKEPSEWYTKITKGKEMGCIPFNRFSLGLFGDNGVLIEPAPLNVRRAVLELAKTKNWTTVSNINEILEDLSSLSDSEIRTTARKYAVFN